MEIKTKLESILLGVEKPARYIGDELNISKKENAFFKMAISYPDLYDVAMANSGIMILYDAVNSLENCSCERVFAVAKDFHDLLKENNIPLYTLENYTPIKEMDLLGFNLSHEMLITNVLQILDLGGIALYQKDRKEDDPIILAGGETTSNPAPVSDFFDALFIGEGEEGVPEIVEFLKEAKEKNLSRKEKLKGLSKIEGVFVPSLHEVKTNDDNELYYMGDKIKRRYCKNAVDYNVLKPIVPNLRITQSRAVVEVTRGCYNLCKFCHAGYYTLPYRQFNIETIRKTIREILDNTGYNEVSFASLSISDFKNLTKLLNILLPEFNEEGISISLPSLKVDTGTLPIIESMSGVRKTSLTFAVESASEEIRKIIHKRVKEEDLLDIITTMLNKGWKTIKLYFMIGLPGYKDHDEAQSIIDLLNIISKIGRGGKKINVTISPFVPKSHTPFQYEEMASIDYFKEVIYKVKTNVPRQISIKNHDPATSRLEGILARADRSIGKVIYNSFSEGAYLDSWREYFKYDIWEKNLDSYEKDTDSLTSSKSDLKNVPWSIIDSGYNSVVNVKSDEILKDEDLTSLRCDFTEELDVEKISDSLESFKSKYEVVQKVRLTFSKKGSLKYISHLDYLEVVRRALRMARLPIAFTQGFNKHERISAGFPLPLGIESNCELIDIDLYQPIDISELMNLNFIGPEGLQLLGAVEIYGKNSIMKQTRVISYTVEIIDPQLIDPIKEGLASGKEITKKTKRGFQTINISDSIYRSEISDNKIDLFLYQGETNAIRIDTLLCEITDMDYLDLSRVRIEKNCQYSLDKDNNLLSF